MPTFALTDDDFTDDEILVSEIMLKAGLISSKGEGRRLIEQGGVSVDDVKVVSPFETVKKSDFKDGQIIIKKGKKVFYKITY